uniref:Uncharacterized protein n=1 Tax=Panagrolaimus sp. ES5 TaxID=591445 RepID=A0AC34FC55_9BILA
MRFLAFFVLLMVFGFASGQFYGPPPYMYDGPGFYGPMSYGPGFFGPPPFYGPRFYRPHYYGYPYYGGGLIGRIIFG